MGKIHLEIFEAQDVLAADSNKKSDPYMKVHVGGREVFRTGVAKKTLTPGWNASCSFDLKSGDEEVLLLCFDQDVGRKDDPLGTAVLLLSEVVINQELWLDIRPDKQCSKAKGRVRVRVAMPQ